VSIREATVWSGVWISLALVFNWLLYQYAASKFSPGEARQVGLDFLTGYLIEKSLSVDNIFIFVVVFGYFGIPAAYQHRVLFYGILGALIFRAIFIAIGAALMQYHVVVVIFGVFLILTGVRMLFAHETKVDPERNLAVRLVRRLLPVTPYLEGPRFFTRQNGVLAATPLLLTLAVVEATDILFAIDSVPAIFAITSEPLIVFTSNIFAILGLRSLYFMLAGAVDKFHLLKYGLGVVLIFVGLKMAWLNNLFGGKFPTSLSLAIIGFVIGASITASLLYPKRQKPQERDSRAA
jgi:tellurite resistance protein TerC